MIALGRDTVHDGIADGALEALCDGDSTHHQRCAILKKLKHVKPRPPRGVQNARGEVAGSYLEGRQVFFDHFATILDGVPRSFCDLVEGDRIRMKDNFLPSTVANRSAAIAPSPIATKRILRDAK